MANPNDQHGSKDKVSGGKDHVSDPAHKTGHAGQKQHTQTGGDQRQQSGSGAGHMDPKKAHDADHKGGHR